MTYLKIDKTELVNLEYSLKREIIRTNRSGAYSCSTIIDCNTRKYHGLLICPITGFNGERHVLLSNIDETIIQHGQEFNLGLHKYASDNYEPKGHKYINDFSSCPIPKLEYRIGGTTLTKEKILVENENQILIKYTLVEAKDPTKIRFKPFLAFRNIHKLSISNLNINTKYLPIENGIASKLYEGYPMLYMQLNKKNEFTPAPDWNYNIEYGEDQIRGYDYKEDLYTPGFFEVAIKKGESIVFSASLKQNSPNAFKRKFDSEIKKRIPRDNYHTCLANTVQQFFVYNKKGIDVIAGFPWLPTRTRDTLIALPGLTLPFYAEKNYLVALKTVERKFQNHLLRDIPEDENSGFPADIPLWFIWSVQQYGILYGKKDIWKHFNTILENIVNGFLSENELFEISDNGLLYCKQNHMPNSWMNSSPLDSPTIYRSGYLVEINALWYNSLRFILELKAKFKDKTLEDRIKNIVNAIETSFIDIFWNESKGYLNDCFETEPNCQLRPNQIFAASLPYSLLDKPIIKSILDNIQSNLLTPYGIRTLSPSDIKYIPEYKGNHNMREHAAFNGSAWPWLLAPFFEAWLKIDPKSAIRNGELHLKNFESELQTDGICSISELYHGNPPQKAKGAISFAINTAELIRLNNIIDNAYKIY
ncbi:MAG: glycogen debranching enzyme N-terminal domain-containing protein [Salinivirgaceae bacterium]|jgi:predicted glycogen debranching enzyme|nr:glycogen debranching enzyme N-terminal domain-containing protein [Salinivirgaceae bacterium]